MFFRPHPGVIRALFLGTLVVLAFATAACGKKTPEDKLAEAQQLLEQRQTPLAILKLRDLIREHPEEDAAIDARFGLAMIYTQLGREENIEAARDLYQELYDMLGVRDERGFHALTQIISFKLEEERYDEVFEIVDAVIEKIGDEPDFQTHMKLQRAMLLLLTGEEDRVAEGIDYLEQEMIGNEDRAMRGQTRELLAMYFRDEGMYQESSAVYTKYLEHFPDDTVKPMMILTKAINSRLAGDEEGRLAYLEEGTRLMTEQIDDELNLNERAEMLSSLAQLLKTAGDLDGAEKAYRRIMADQPATRAAIDAQFAIGQMYLQNNDFDRAEELFRQIRRENANTPIEEMANRGIQHIAQIREQMRAFEEAAAQDNQPADEDAATTDPDME